MEDMKLQIENIILKVENLMQKNTILEMKLEKHMEKYKKYYINEKPTLKWKRRRFFKSSTLE